MKNSDSTRRLKFPPSRRVRSSLDFQKIYNLKRRVSNRWLLIFGAPNELGETRIGLSVSKKNGNSPERHRIRRLLKEAFRLEQHNLPAGFDLILIPRPNSGATVDNYRESLLDLTRTLQSQLQSD